MTENVHISLGRADMPPQHAAMPKASPQHSDR
jgi:hypothetical protein